MTVSLDRHWDPLEHEEAMVLTEQVSKKYCMNLGDSHHSGPTPRRGQESKEAGLGSCAKECAATHHQSHSVLRAKFVIDDCTRHEDEGVCRAVVVLMETTSLLDGLRPGYKYVQDSRAQVKHMY